MAAPVLEVEGVRKAFNGREALAGVSARLLPGTIGLVGPNGAGKTTLLKLLMGLLTPSAGRLHVLGHDCVTEPLRVRAGIGYMPEHDCLIPAMSGVGFVAYMGEVSGLPRERAMSRAHDVLQFVGLREERYRRIAEYSTGMRQRVKLAQALVHDPPLCLLDEPTAGLDPHGRAEMLGLLRALGARAERSILLSTHLLPDVEGLCDQILMLHEGRVLAAGPLAPLLAERRHESVVRIQGPAEAFLAALARRDVPARPDDDRIRLDLPPGEEARVFAAAHEAGVAVRSLTPSVRSVEELFLALVEPGRPS